MNRRKQLEREVIRRPLALDSIFITMNKQKQHPYNTEFQKLAERVRFELTGPAKARRFSRPVHSTALPPLRTNIPEISKHRFSSQ